MITTVFTTQQRYLGLSLAFVYALNIMQKVTKDLQWFSTQLLVNPEIFKLSLNLSLTRLRAQSACYE